VVRRTGVDGMLRHLYSASRVVHQIRIVTFKIRGSSVGIETDYGLVDRRV
jgi:hypothetical protein